MGKRIKQRTALGGRIARLRDAYVSTTHNSKGEEVKIQGMKQSELARLLQDKMDDGTHLTTTLISAWETGRRGVPLKYNKYLCEIFGVTEDYLLGYTDGASDEVQPSGPLQKPESLFEILETELPDYDGEPVWVTFPNFEKDSQWAIYDGENDTLIFKKEVRRVGASAGLRYYSKIPDYESKSAKAKRSLEYAQVVALERVYVIMTSPDPAIRNRYSGWYMNNADHNCLINPWSGQMLPYEGLNVSYHAYSTGDRHDRHIDESLYSDL